jgi:hypothetical protein
MVIDIRRNQQVMNLDILYKEILTKQKLLIFQVFMMTINPNIVIYLMKFIVLKMTLILVIQLLLVPNTIRRFVKMYTMARYPSNEDVDERSNKVFGKVKPKEY